MQSTIGEKVGKGLVNGAVSSVASMLLGEGGGAISVFGMQVSNPLAIGGSNFFGSIAGDYSNEMWYPDKEGTAKYDSLPSGALAPAVSGGVSSLLLNRRLNSTALNAAALGAGSYIASDYIYSYLKKGPEPNY